MPKKRPLGQLSPAERTEVVRGIFASIPRWYDFLNRLLSLRRDVAWRRATVEGMVFFRTNAFLDVATGTADLAMDAARQHPGIKVAGIDFVPEMLEVGRRKLAEQGLAGRVALKEADALALPYEDDSFDVAAIAFGIRNIPDRVGALREMARVVVPGGQVMVLELTTPSGGLVRAAYGVYLRGIVPLLGRLLSRDARAYGYLADSIMDFPSPEEFARLMQQAGFKDVRKRPLTMGVAHLHTGRVQ